jgi:signal transduction histidine kinase
MLFNWLRFQDIRRTSTFRLTVLLGLVFIVGIIGLLGLIYALTARELTARNDRILREEAARLLALPPTALPARIRTEIGRDPPGLSFFALIARDGERVVGNLNVVGGIVPDRPVDREASGSRGPIRLMAFRTAFGETIVVGRDISQIHDLRKRLLDILLGSGIIMIFSMALAAVLLSARPLRRVQDLQIAARKIASGKLDVRMPIAGVQDELDQFAETVNKMVEEVARVLAEVKGVTDSIAHDLRTPLTRVRSHLHHAKELPDVSPAFASLAENAVSDLDVVLTRFAALLRISELEASGRRAGFGQVDLLALAESARDLYEPLAEEAGLFLSLENGPAVTIDADENLLFEALSNLADNAIKFARTSVTISIIRDGQNVLLEVRDDGPGIPDEERDAVLRRFHRGTQAIGRPGSGLGLSLVVAILHLHGFDLSFDDARPGLVARLRIPAQDVTGR